MPRGSLEQRVRRLRLPLRTRRLELVLPDPAQVPGLVELLRTPEIARWTLHIPYPYAPSDAREYVQRARRRFRAGKGLSLQILRREDRALLGGIGLHDLSDEGARAEVGYWLGRRYRGMGYVAEAVEAVLKMGFRELGLHRIEAGVLPGNRASIAVLRRAGFTREGVLRDYVKKDGRWCTTLVFSRLSTDRPRRGPPD